MTANGLVHGGCIPCGPGSDDVVTLSWRVRCRRTGRSAPIAACWSLKKHENLGPRHHASHRVTLVMYFLRGLCSLDIPSPGGSIHENVMFQNEESWLWDDWSLTRTFGLAIPGWCYPLKGREVAWAYSHKGESPWPLSSLLVRYCRFGDGGSTESTFISGPEGPSSQTSESQNVLQS